MATVTSQARTLGQTGLVSMVKSDHSAADTSSLLPTPVVYASETGPASRVGIWLADV